MFSKTIVNSKKQIASIVLISILLVSGNAFAHGNVIAKDNEDEYTGRDYKEGSDSVFMEMAFPHGCHKVDQNGEHSYEDTKHIVAILPNTVDLTGIAYTEDWAGNRFGGNAMMEIKPLYDNNWKKIKIEKETVTPFFHHAEQDEDVTSIKWLKGNVPNEFVAKLTFRATLPKLDGCVEKLKINVPTVQYCKGGAVAAWIKEPTPSLPVDVISPGYTAFYNVLRDHETNPLPATCGDVGEVVEVYPSVDDIENGLLHNPRWDQE